MTVFKKSSHDYISAGIFLKKIWKETHITKNNESSLLMPAQHIPIPRLSISDNCSGLLEPSD